MGVFSGTPLVLAFPLRLGVRLLWHEDPATVVTSEPGSIAETLLRPNNGVSSSGAVCIGTVMIFRSAAGGNYERKMGKVEEERGMREER
jgi:hypothetical protein